MAGPGTASEVDKMVQTIISRAHEEAYATLEKYERQLHDIAGYLLEKETITGEEFMDILNRSLEFYGMESLEEKKTEEENHDQRNE